MAEFINLNYYFRADIYDYQLILDEGFFDNHKTNGIYGKAIYLVDDRNINLNGKNVILNVDLSDIDGILFVETYDQLLQHYIFPEFSRSEKDFKQFGRSSIFGNRYICRFINKFNLNGIKVKNENILILINNKNIRFIRLYDEELKTLRDYAAPDPTFMILQGPTDPSISINDGEYSKQGEGIIDENGDTITHGTF